jgi:hypothetical protein
LTAWRVGARATRESIRGVQVIEIKMPQLGESVTEGTIGRWLKRPGEMVAKYEPLLEVISLHGLHAYPCLRV